MRTKIPPMRIRLFAGAGAVALMASVGVGSALAQDEASEELGGSVVFVGYGGTVQECQRDAWGKPFAEQYGVDFLEDEAPSVAKIKTQVDSGNVQWDVVAVTQADLPNLVAQDLIVPIDYSVWDEQTLENVTEDFRSEWGVGAVAYSLGISYRTDLGMDEHPTTWAEFWDTERFPGPRAMPAGTFPNPPWEAALLADGVAPEDLYPLDLERATASLDKIKDDVTVWFEDTAAGVQTLVSGEVDYALLPNGRVLQAKSQGAPVDFEYEESFLNLDYHVVPKGAPNEANAMEFIHYLSAVEPSLGFMECIPYGMPNSVANEQLDPEYATQLPTATENVAKSVVVNGEFYGSESPSGDTWQEAGIRMWNEWYGQ